MPNIEEPSLFISIKPHSTESEQSEEVDMEELERTTYDLRNDLNQLDIVEKVDLFKKGEAPEHSKAGAEIVSWGSLLVTLATTATGMIPSLSNTLQSWLTRHERYKVVINYGSDKLEMSGASDEDRRKLIDHWVSRHGQSSNR